MILDLQLSTGRRVWAPSLRIESTYSGLHCGYPTRLINDMTLERVPGYATRSLDEWPVHLIEPGRRIVDVPYARPDSPREDLPHCWIVAEFKSLSIDDESCGSLLYVVWFQDEPFPIPSEAALARLREVDWDSLAKDYDD